jgi:DNA-binding NtrC family response regulator
MRAVMHLVQVYAPRPRNILLLGATGVGKGLVARRIHAMSGAVGNFIALAGGQLSDTLVLSQLFGHLRGAFTDAKERFKGAFEQAVGGTLFLDEIPHWSLLVQSALLVPLGEGSYRPIGSERDLSVSSRIVFASTIGPDDLVHERRLLPDLRWRLPQIEINIPALSDRKPDILWLAGSFLDEFRQELGVSSPLSFSPEVVEALLGHSWPGNVRELRSTIDLAVIHAAHVKRATIEIEDLPLSFAQTTPLRVADADQETLRRAVGWALGRTGGRQGPAALLLGVHRNTVSRHSRWRDRRAPLIEAGQAIANPIRGDSDT